MAIRIRQSLIKSWSGPSERQFGIDQPTRLRLDSQQHETFLAMLELGVADNQINAAAKLAGLRPEQAMSMISELGHLLEDSKPNLAAPEIENLPSPHSRSFRTRQSAMVYLPKLDRLGRLVLQTLAHSGIGLIVVGDNTLVTESDCGRLGYGIDQLGKPKLGILRSEVENTPAKIKLDNRMNWSDYADIDIALVSSSGVFQPTDYQRWQSLGVSHIGVCFSDLHVSISAPVTSKSACLSCRELNHWRTDPGRQLVASQIAGSSGLRDSVSILFASSLASQKILKAVDGIQDKQDLKLLNNGEIEFVTAGTNPECGCQRLREEI